MNNSIDNNINFSVGFKYPDADSEAVTEDNNKLKQLEFLNDFIFFILNQPNPNTALVAVAITFKMPISYLYGSKSNKDIAKQIGVSEQALSKAIIQIQKHFNLL